MRLTSARLSSAPSIPYRLRVVGTALCLLGLCTLGLRAAELKGSGTSEGDVTAVATESDEPAVEGSPSQDPQEVMDLFAAIEAEQIEVQFIPKNATQATVVIKNQTPRKIKLRMPDAFAAVPVLAQVGGGNIGGGIGAAGGGLQGGGGLGQQNNANQGVGGGFGGGMGGGMMGGMGGGMMGGGGMFNVGPERTHKIRVQTVCLEHGKPDPNPRVPYALQPIRSFTDQQEVIEVCRMLARGDVDQVSAQAAAWHLTDNLSWPELANKVKVRHQNGSVELYFGPQHVQRAMLVTVRARQLAELSERQQVISPGELAESK